VTIADAAPGTGGGDAVVLRPPAVPRARQNRFEFVLDQIFDEGAHPIAHRMLNRIEPGVKKTLVRAGAALGHVFASPSNWNCAEEMLSFVMAWSPARRANARRFEVDHPGDYATLNSNQSRDSTRAIAKCDTIKTSQLNSFTNGRCDREGRE